MDDLNGTDSEGLLDTIMQLGKQLFGVVGGLQRQSLTLTISKLLFIF